MKKNQNQIDRAVEKSMQQDMPCILCGETTRNRGVFIPDDPRQSHLGSPPAGKTRTVIYALCDRHPQNSATSKAVELALESKMLSRNN